MGIRRLISRCGVLVVVGLVGLLALAAVAWADADMSVTGSVVTYQIRSVAGPDGNQVGQFVRTGSLQSDTSSPKPGETIGVNNPSGQRVFDGTGCSGSDLLDALFGNLWDVCTLFTGSSFTINVNEGDGDDSLTALGNIFLAGNCAASGGTNALQMNVNLGPGKDEFDYELQWGTTSGGCTPGDALGKVTASGGAGDDTIQSFQQTGDNGPSVGPVTLNGDAGNDKLVGGFLDDTLNGGDDVDNLIGGTGNDTLNPGDGTDTVSAGAGNDTVNAIDGHEDTISCGAGNDRAFLDLKDTVTLVGPPGFGLPDCEIRTFQAVDDSPPGHPLEQPVKLGRSEAMLRFVCPAAARPRCRGQLTLRDAARPAGTVGHVAYSLRLGTTATIHVPLTPAALARLHKSRRVLVDTVEAGHSKVGPRRSGYLLATTR